jgi:hypothetical protein
MPNLRLGSARTAPTGRALRFHPSVRARRFLFRSPHTSPAKCLRIPRSTLRTVHRTVQSGYAGPSLPPHTGRVSGCPASASPTSEGLPSRSGRFASTPRFGRGTSNLSHRTHSKAAPPLSPQLSRTTPHTSERTTPRAAITKNKLTITIG